MRGRLLVLEGIDGAGKTLQIERLKQYLEAEGRTVRCLREPGGTWLGEELRQLLLSGKQRKASTQQAEVLSREAESPAETKASPAGLLDAPTSRAELALFLAARAELCEKIIKPALSRGEWLICDRFWYSTLAYQGRADGADLDQLRRLNLFFSGDVVADVLFYLRLPVELASQRQQQRGEADRMEAKGLLFLEEVHQKYDWIFEREARLTAEGLSKTQVCLVDASLSPDEVFVQIQEGVKRLLSSR